jgi:hypothetical protein
MPSHILFVKPLPQTHAWDLKDPLWRIFAWRQISSNHYDPLIKPPWLRMSQEVIIREPIPVAGIT